MDTVRKATDTNGLVRWLMSNANRFNKMMFYDDSFDWRQIELQHVLLLRAVLGDSVFVQEAKSEYLRQNYRSAEKVELADAIFAPDAEFLRRLPLSVPASVRPLLLTLIEWGQQVRR